MAKPHENLNILDLMGSSNPNFNGGCRSMWGVFDALPSPGVNPLEGSPKCSCGKLGLGRRSRLPTLERGRGSSWEPRD